MKHLLITNIGNRNIKYKNQNIPTDNFKSETEKIWKNIEKEKEHISVQIIPNHIHPDTERIILIATLQEDKNYNYQDTYFVGLILQFLLKEKYSLPVDVEVFKGNPTNENEIFPFYSDLIRKTAGNNIEKIIFNDAGGTPQMKLAVKELLGYYFKEIQYAIVYSDQLDKKRDIKRIYKNKYVLLNTARKFVEQFNYQAALRILDEIDDDAGVTTVLYELISFAAQRINFEIENIESYLNNKHLPKQYQRTLRNLLPDNTNECAVNIEVLNKHSRRQVYEIASICQLYFNTENYTLGVATFYRLMEEFFNRFVKNHSKIDLTSKSNRDKFIDQYFDSMQSAFRNLYPERDLFKTYGLPLLSLYTYIHADDRTKIVVELFMRTISLFRDNPHTGLDLLRNKCFLAHKNNAVSASMINKTEPEFFNTILPSIYKALNMPDENVYFTMNQIMLYEFLNN